MKGPWYSNWITRAIFKLFGMSRPQHKSGLDRPYQDHLGGLDKAYKRPLKKQFKGLSEAF